MSDFESPWPRVKLNSFGTLHSGGTPSKQNRALWSGTLPWVSSKDIKKRMLYTSEDHVSEQAVGRGTRLIQPGTVLIVVRGMSLANRLPVAMAAVPMTFNQDLKALTLRDGVNPLFMLYWLLSEEDRVLALATESTHGTKRLPTPDLLSLDVPLPPPEEQRAIAEALSGVDELIEGLEKLIEKKRAVKQAAMQQLLTGQSAAWQPRTLGSLGAFHKGRGVLRSDVSEIGHACVRYGELYTRFNNYVDEPASRVPTSVAMSALQVVHGDLLFAGSGETAEEIGKCAALMVDEPCVAGGDIVVLRPHEGDPVFLGHIMNAPEVAAQKTRLGQGDAVVHVSASALTQVAVRLPDLEEQRRIGRTLWCFDQEIGFLSARLAKTRDVKRGMMQQLLTGRTRLAGFGDPR